MNEISAKDSKKIIQEANKEKELQTILSKMKYYAEYGNFYINHKIKYKIVLQYLQNRFFVKRIWHAFNMYKISWYANGGHEKEELRKIATSFIQTKHKKLMDKIWTLINNEIKEGNSKIIFTNSTNIVTTHMVYNLCIDILKDKGFRVSIKNKQGKLLYCSICEYPKFCIYHNKYIILTIKV